MSELLPLRPPLVSLAPPVNTWHDAGRTIRFAVYTKLQKIEPAGFPASTSILISRHHLRTKNPRLKKSVGQLYHRYTTVLHSLTARIIINTFGVCNFKVCFKSPLQKKCKTKDYYLRHICLSAWKNSAPTGRIFTKFDIWRFFSKICRENLTVVLKKTQSYTTHIYNLNMYMCCVRVCF